MTPSTSEYTDHLNGSEERFHTIVIGGGQAGLMVGQELQKRGFDFVILDASTRIGDSWRKRWDSLMLFTPARMNALPGLPFPARGDAYISKDEIAHYLEDYAERMDLPIRSGVRVDQLSKRGSEYMVIAGDRTLVAANIIVAMADYQVPYVPEFAPDLDPDVIRLHSSQYKNPSQLQAGDTLVVGLGNSGADIALEVAKSRRTYLAGNESGHVPFRLESRFGRWIGVRLVRFAAVNVLNTSTPIGRRARPKMLTKSAPLVRVKPKDLAAAGVERVPRITAIKHGRPETTDGRVLDVANVIWCTGFKPGFTWIKLPIFEENGSPRHERGVVPNQPGLYFVGLYFLHALWSETLTGVQADARHVVDDLARRERQSTVVVP